MTSDEKEELQLSSFGELLKVLRKRAGLSQLQLAENSKTTARYISFVETGRSRPGHQVVMRISKALNLLPKEHNLLLASAGIPSEYVGHEPFEETDTIFFESMQSILDNHSPNPACAVDTLSRIVMTNESFRRILPRVDNRTPEESIDDFFGSQRMRDLIVNWAEVAWAFIDRRQLEAVRSNDIRLLELSERALAYMNGIERPQTLSDEVPMTLEVTFRLGEQELRSSMVALRCENVVLASPSELRLELFFPADEVTASAFRALMEM